MTRVLLVIAAATAQSRLTLWQKAQGCGWSVQLPNFGPFHPHLTPIVPSSPVHQQTYQLHTPQWSPSPMRSGPFPVLAMISLPSIAKDVAWKHVCYWTRYPYRYLQSINVLARLYSLWRSPIGYCSSSCCNYAPHYTPWSEPCSGCPGLGEWPAASCLVWILYKRLGYSCCSAIPLSFVMRYAPSQHRRQNCSPRTSFANPFIVCATFASFCTIASKESKLWR